MTALTPHTPSVLKIAMTLSVNRSSHESLLEERSPVNLFEDSSSFLQSTEPRLRKRKDEDLSCSEQSFHGK